MVGFLSMKKLLAGKRNLRKKPIAFSMKYNNKKSPIRENIDNMIITEQLNKAEGLVV